MTGNTRATVKLACPACGAAIDADAPSELAVSRVVQEPVRFHQCAACKCLYAPTAAKLAEVLYAARDSTNFAPHKLALLREVKRAVLRSRYAGYLHEAGAQRLVDFGCGNGDLAQAFVGLVPSIVAVDVPEQRPEGLDGTIAYHSVNDPHFAHAQGRSVYILRHVLEHFDAPAQQMASLATGARSGDLFIIETPNEHSLFRKLMGVGWPGFFPPFHVTVPSRDALSAIARNAGLLIVGERRREPVIIGTYFTQKYRSGSNLFRILGIAAYPLQWLASRVTGHSEAIELTLCKS